MDGVYKNTEEYYSNKQRKILIAFYDMITDMLNNKIPTLVVTEVFIRGRKLNIFLVFITQSYIAVLINVRLNRTHYFIMKIPNENFKKSNLIFHEVMILKTL